MRFCDYGLKDDDEKFDFFEDYPRFYINDEEIDLFNPRKVLAQIDNNLWSISDVIDKYNDVNSKFFNNEFFINNDPKLNEYWFNIFKEKYQEFSKLFVERNYK